MNLPADPKERVKIYVLVGIGAALVVFLLVKFVIFRVIDAKKDVREQIEKLELKQKSNEQDIRNMTKGQRENLDTLISLAQIMDGKKTIIEPQFGNYMLGATEFVESCARDSGLSVTITEVGITQLPQEPKKDVYFKAFTARVSLRCGTHDLVAFLRRLESQNPYMCMSLLTMQSRPETPDLHEVSFELQWPVWFDDDMSRQISERLGEAMAAGNEDPKGRRKADAGEGS